MTPCTLLVMFRKLKARQRRAKLKRLIKDHAAEIIFGALMGLLTDVLTDFAHRKMELSLGGRLRRAI